MKFSAKNPLLARAKNHPHQLTPINPPMKRLYFLLAIVLISESAFGQLTRINERIFGFITTANFDSLESYALTGEAFLNMAHWPKNDSTNLLADSLADMNLMAIKDSARNIRNTVLRSSKRARKVNFQNCDCISGRVIRCKVWGTTCAVHPL